MQAIPVFVISLARSPDRRVAIRAHLDRLGVDYEIIDAIDGKSLDPIVFHRLTEGRTIHAGAVGCYLSHINVYKKVVEKNMGVALILEDDAVLSPGAVDLLHSGCESLDFDYCFLDSEDHGETGPVFYNAGHWIPVSRNLKAFELSAGPHCTHAYLVTNHAAQMRLEHAIPIKKSIDNYSHLPYPIRFCSILKPKLAWVSEHSLKSFTSKRSIESADLPYFWLRRYPLFYLARDLIRLKPVHRRIELHRLVKSGALAKRGKWRPLPSGREVVPLRYL
jgi:GR25 family glycosyltransferase involved in LPS biosynthesis